MLRTIFTDYDGVFHPISALHWFNLRLPVDVCIERGRLFRWTWILSEILEPHPDVRIVVHSSWRLLHPEYKVRELLGPLAARYIGAISREYDRADGIVAYVEKHHISDYRILDDHPECFPNGTTTLIHCDSETGVYGSQVRIQLKNWLGKP
ncbi:HAD domain-containing protein [Herbaspirillum sp. GCM10030257]|uniref:HAD domain-containing protein n=1 Tax=Herbaspirillum sp. GCM10030257 TaxID=3273393 RepID=UPI00360D5602